MIKGQADKGLETAYYNNANRARLRRLDPLSEALPLVGSIRQFVNAGMNASGLVETIEGGQTGKPRRSVKRNRTFVESRKEGAWPGWG